MIDGAAKSDNFQTNMTMNQTEQAMISVGGVYKVECLDADGHVKWVEEFNNLVVNEGLNSMNNVYFYYSSTAQIQTWYMGLMGAVTSGVAAGDTLASHTGWAEFTDYSGNRPSISWASSTTASPSVITSSARSFSITGTGTVTGAFVCSVTSGTSGVLFSAKTFSASRNVVSGDTLNVTYSLSNAAA